MGQMIGSHNVPTEDQQIQDEEYWGYDVKTVEEITKPKLGKLIIDYCGNEGIIDDERTGSIRKLLQRAITNLEPLQEQYPGVWRDAELKIFDLYGNGYVVKSGEGSVKFVAQITGNGDVELSKVNDQSFLASMKALVWRQNSQQLQIKGAPPDQSNARKGWFPFKSPRSIPWLFSRSKPERNQEGGLSQSSTEHDESSLDSPSVMESDGKVAADDQHGNDSLIGHDEGGEIQNNNPRHAPTVLKVLAH
ncbi:PREDICTED: uncharacterized protein LOC109465238 isoform X2 [Branchiostoma belcheri]|nr:PREDICTED: uncharacterized protein LOC109465238 isoform X2 [Branchiostoma belcheri]